MRILLVGALLFAGAAYAEEPAPFTCESPQIPEVSTSNDAARRVEKRIADWKTCAAEYQASNPTEASLAQVQRAYDEIVERRNKWVAASNRYSSVQAANRTRPTLGTNGLAAAWESRNVHDMSPHIKQRTEDNEAGETTPAAHQ
jgi:hypothetical protein